MEKNHLHKKFVKFLLARHASRKMQASSDVTEEVTVEPDEVINQLVAEYKKVKSEYENLLR
jgi:hypothetical protein